MKVCVYTKQKGDRSPLLLGSSGLAGDTDLQYHVTGVIQEGCAECCRNAGGEQSTWAEIRECEAVLERIHRNIFIKELITVLRR